MNVVCLDEEPVIEIVCVDVRSAFSTAPHSLPEREMFSNADPSMVSAADSVSVITDFDRLIDASLEDGLTGMDVSVSVPVDASNTEPVIILPASFVRMNVSEVKERVAAAERTKREEPSVNLQTVLEEST